MTPLSKKNNENSLENIPEDENTLEKEGFKEGLNDALNENENREDEDAVNDPDDELLTAYIDDELDPTEREKVEKRLAKEAALANRLRRLREASAFLDSLETVPPPPQFTETTMAALTSIVQKEIQASEKRHFRRSLFFFVLLILLAGGVFWASQRGVQFLVSRHAPPPSPPFGPPEFRGEWEPLRPMNPEGNRRFRGDPTRDAGQDTLKSRQKGEKNPPRFAGPRGDQPVPPPKPDMMMADIIALLPEPLKNEKLTDRREEFQKYLDECPQEEFTEKMPMEILLEFIQKEGTEGFIADFSESAREYIESLPEDQRVRMIALVLLGNLMKDRDGYFGDFQGRDFPGLIPPPEMNPDAPKLPADSERPFPPFPEDDFGKSPTPPPFPFARAEMMRGLAETLKNLTPELREEILNLPEDEMLSRLAKIYRQEQKEVKDLGNVDSVSASESKRKNRNVQKTKAGKRPKNNRKE